MPEYAHMCRDGHPEIGFNGGAELCPVCDRVGELEAIIDRLVNHDWIISTAYKGGTIKDFGYVVNTRDAPSQRTGTQTYTQQMGTFAATPIEAGRLGLEAATSEAGK